MEVPVAEHACSQATFWADLLKMVGFPAMTALYFAWKDIQFTKAVTEKLTEISERLPHREGRK